MTLIGLGISKSTFFCRVWLHSLSFVYLYQLFYIVHLLLLYLLLFSLLVQFSSTLNIIILLFRAILSLISSNWLVSVPSWSFPPVAALSLFSSIKALTSSSSIFLSSLFSISSWWPSWISDRQTIHKFSTGPAKSQFNWLGGFWQEDF